MSKEADNMRAREEAEAAFALAFEAATALPEELRKRYWEVLLHHVADVAGVVEPERRPPIVDVGDNSAHAGADGWALYDGYIVADRELSVGLAPGEGADVEFWLPKSQLGRIEYDVGGDSTTIRQGSLLRAVEIPDWLARDKGL